MLVYQCKIIYTVEASSIASMVGDRFACRNDGYNGSRDWLAVELERVHRCKKYSIVFSVLLERSWFHLLSV